MKQIYLFLILMIFGIASFGQTATNFTCTDCNGGSHDLFTELDAGKVVVLCWVMPCSTCIPNSKTSYNVVNSYQTNYPNRVFFYMVDDFADTPCSSLNSWANTNGIPQSAFSQRFVNSAISIDDYGTYAMPKIVVIGGTTHSVFFNNSVNAFNATNLQNAINNALNSTGIEDLGSNFNKMSLYPIPAGNQSTLSIDLNEKTNVKVEIYNVVGKKVSELNKDQLSSGINEIQVNTADLTNGIYFVKVSIADRNKLIKLVVSH